MLFSIPRFIAVLNFENVANDIRIVRIQTIKLCTKRVYLLPSYGFDSWRSVLKFVLPTGTWIEPTFFSDAFQDSAGRSAFHVDDLLELRRLFDKVQAGLAKEGKW